MSLKLDLSPDHSAFSVELPAGHHVEVPATPGGLHVLLRLLREQARADLNAALAADHHRAFVLRGAIGTPASPTMQEVTHMLDHGEDHFDSCPFCRERKRQSAKAPKQVLTPADFNDFA